MYKMFQEAEKDEASQTQSRKKDNLKSSLTAKFAPGVLQGPRKRKAVDYQESPTPTKKHKPNTETPEISVLLSYKNSMATIVSSAKHTDRFSRCASADYLVEIGGNLSERFVGKDRSNPDYNDYLTTTLDAYLQASDCYINSTVPVDTWKNPIIKGLAKVLGKHADNYDSTIDLAGYLRKQDLYEQFGRGYGLKEELDIIFQFLESKIAMNALVKTPQKPVQRSPFTSITHSPDESSDSTTPRSTI